MFVRNVAANYSAKRCEEQKPLISTEGVEISYFIVTDFSLNLILRKNVHTISGVQSAPFSMGNGASFPWNVELVTHRYLILNLIMSCARLPLTQHDLVACKERDLCDANLSFMNKD
jgi:predicted AlkP superfamily pyrophosphatase or phosphodiesterase